MGVSFNGLDVPLRDASPTIGARGVSEYVVYKSADKTLNNVAVLEDDNHLKFPIAANEVWVGYLVVFVLGNGAADWQGTLAVPSGATVIRSGIGQRATDQVAEARGHDPMVFGVVNTDARHMHIAFSVTNGVTAGNVTLQWAQNTQTVGDTTVKAGSFLVARRAVATA